jgi:hypothetical protein
LDCWGKYLNLLKGVGSCAIFFLNVKICFFTILEKLAFLQKILHEKKRPREITMVAYQINTIHLMYINSKKYEHGHCECRIPLKYFQ